MAPPRPILQAPVVTIDERRIDEGGSYFAKQLQKRVENGGIIGLISATLSSDGRMEMVISGSLHDHPGLASALASKLRALADSWEQHPGAFIPD